MFWKKQKPQATTFFEFEKLFNVLTKEAAEYDLNVLNSAPKPAYVFDKEVPDDLNMLEYGVYCDLCDALDNENHFEIVRNIVKVLFNDVTDNQIDNESAYKLWGLANWAIKEIDRINKLFSSINVDYSDQEKRAGIDKLQFGTFGILDWYAKRMGIHDHNEVNSTKWVRIWQCMKNDSEESAYNRRLQKVYESDSKLKH